MREIKGNLYRIRTHGGKSFLIEVEGDANSELCAFCADKAVKGYIITSVTQIFHDASDTPKVPILGTKEYKNALAKAREALSGSTNNN